jgi:hypothetical protein
MEDILASIRRILSEEEPAVAPGPAATPVAAAEAGALEQRQDDVLVLDPSMLVGEEPPAAAMPEAEPVVPPVTAPLVPPPLAPPLAPIATPPPLPPMEIMPPPTLLAPETAAAATSAVGNLMRTLATERTLQVHRDGPTIEDIVREELRPLLKQWLDANLPDLVERLVRNEIERVVRRAVP